MTKIIRLTRMSLKNGIKNRDTVIVMLFLLSYFSFVFPASSKSVIKAGEHVNMFAPFIHGILRRDFQIIVLLGSIMMLGMRNAIEHNKINVLMRVEKKEWLASEILTMVLTCIVYAGIVVFLTMIFYFPVMTPKACWGDGIDNYHFFAGRLKAIDTLYDKNVYLVFLESFILVVLVTILLGEICLLCDRAGNNRMGPMICGALIVWNLMVQAADEIPDFVSPIGMLNGYIKGAFGFHALYLFILNLILTNIIWNVGKKNDAI